MTEVNVVIHYKGDEIISIHTSQGDAEYAARVAAREGEYFLYDGRAE